MSMARSEAADSGISVHGAATAESRRVLTPAALAFLEGLESRFGSRRRDLLAARRKRQAQFDSGVLPDFLPETRSIRESDWTVAPIPADLQNRRVEITGPVDRKMVINALNSGAQTFMADFEDSCSPTWSNLIEGQINLMDLHDGDLQFTDPRNGKHYAVGENPAVLLVRPRGWHLEEAHVEVDGKPMSASLFDFGLYAFHNAGKRVAAGTAPYFYLPKLESHLEARLWNDVFLHAQESLNLPTGTFRATVLIETLPAAFEMDEILYELRDHIAGLNCGRWDYIFSFVKCLSSNPDYLLPDRSQVVMGEAFLDAYSLLLIKTCHRRGAFAMGGMAAQIPVKGDQKANEAAFGLVRADKEREARAGHDGTWVAHPALVPVAMEVFDALMPAPNQMDKLRDDAAITRDDMLKLPSGERTEAGLRNCMDVGVRYIAAWLGGRGAVPIHNLMEDAATAEICRTQIWQWLKHGARLADGRTVDDSLFHDLLKTEMHGLRQSLGEESWNGGHFEEAVALFSAMTAAPECEPFLTLSAYRHLVAHDHAQR